MTAATRAHLTPLQIVFALNGLGIALWFPRIPDVKAALGLDVLTLSFCLFGLPAGTMLGFVTVGPVIRAIGTRPTVAWGGALFLLCFIGPALAWDAVSLGLTLFLCGLTIAAIEVSMNAKASQTEGALGRRIMTQCHGFWSFGAVAGAMIGGGFAQLEIPFLVQQALLQPICAAATIFFAGRLLPDAPTEPAAERGPRRVVLPSRPLLLLCLVPLGALLIEGAMMEWSALLLRQDLGASPLATAATFAAFATAMACMRLAGDRLAETFGPRRVILGSAALMAVSMAAFALSPTIWLSIPLAALVGVGCANIYPLTMSIVAPLPGQPSEKNVATLALTAFTAFLIGPPFIGLVASSVGLPIALALLAPLGALPFLLPTRPAAASSRPAAAPR